MPAIVVSRKDDVVVLVSNSAAEKWTDGELRFCDRIVIGGTLTAEGSLPGLF